MDVTGHGLEQDRYLLPVQWQYCQKLILSAMKVKISVIEQPPVACGSILCEFKLTSANGSHLIGDHMYFVCNTDRVLIQYPGWLLKEYGHQLKKLGYSW